MIRAVPIMAAVALAVLPVPVARERPPAPAYDAVWLWAGVKAQPALASAKRLYLLQGQIEATDPVRYTAQRAAVPRLGNREVWMVVRVETLDWTPAIYEQLLSALGRWRAAGNRVVGVQIDFDARTTRRRAPRFDGASGIVSGRSLPQPRIGHRGDEGKAQADGGRYLYTIASGARTPGSRFGQVVRRHIGRGSVARRARRFPSPS